MTTETATKFEQYLDRKRREYGERFNDSELAPGFVRYFNTGERIRVRTSYGAVITGTVGVTTGWRPCFLLMPRSDSRGSSETLSVRDAVVAVKRGRGYVAVA